MAQLMTKRPLPAAASSRNNVLQDCGESPPDRLNPPNSRDGGSAALRHINILSVTHSRRTGDGGAVNYGL